MKPLLCASLCLLFVGQAAAMEYTLDAPEDFLFGRPTSQEVIYEQTPVNVDRSKDVALVAPTFGSPTSYLIGSGEHLTPNLVPGAMSGGLVNSIGNADYSSLGSNYFSVDGYTAAGSSGITAGSPAASPNTTGADITVSSIPTVAVSSKNPSTVSFTEATSDLYYKGGHLGTLSIPSLKLNVNIYQGTGDSSLAKGIGHFEDTSIWNGNVGLAGHNRGVNSYFGQIHTLKIGAEITLTTKLGSRTYTVQSVEKVGVEESEKLNATSQNCLTLYTCVRDQPGNRWCVRAVEE